QRGIPRRLRRDVEAGLRTRARGRRDTRPVGGPQTQPPSEPRYRRRGGPAGGARRRSRPARRLDRDGAESGGRRGRSRAAERPPLAKAFKFDLNAPWRDLSAPVRKVLLEGAPGKTFTYQYDSERWHGSYESGWKGVLANVERRYRETMSDGMREQLDQYMVEQ